AGALLLTMLANGRASTENALVLLALSPVVGLGIAVLTGLPGFMVLRALRPKNRFEPERGESIKSDVAANHFLRNEGRGGRLFVTDRRLVFVPHRFNVQLDRVEQRLADVRAIQWARVVGQRGLVFSCVMEVVEE